jgi:hypothetical protein
MKCIKFSFLRDEVPRSVFELSSVTFSASLIPNRYHTLENNN